MSRACVNPLNTDDHNGPGGDQFCVFCLRKRGDDALMMVGQLAEVLRAVEWSAQYGYDETAGACPSCGYPEHEPPRSKACSFMHYDRIAGCSSCAAIGAGPPVERGRMHARDCALEAAIRKAERLLT